MSTQAEGADPKLLELKVEEMLDRMRMRGKQKELKFIAGQKWGHVLIIDLRGCGVVFLEVVGDVAKESEWNMI